MSDTPGGTPNAAPPLSPRERRFVEEYCANGFRGADAARAVGFTGAHVRKSADRLLKRPHIQAAIEARLRDLADGAQLRSEAILLELAKIAFADIGQVIDFSGADLRLRPANEIPGDARAAIESLKVKRYLEGQGEHAREVEVTEFKLHDKLGALEKLGRYRRLFVERTAHENPDGSPMRFTLAIGDQGEPR